ncbi:MAG: hypothetical protein AAFR61_26895 [Bacteroidota bacterium]
MKKYCLIGLLFCFLNPAMMAQLSEAWHGTWQGEVEIWEQNRLQFSFPMSLEIMPQDSGLTFSIHYDRGGEKPDIRRYSLLSITDSVGHYVIDEHNSILLDAYQNGPCLYNHFAGMETLLQMRMCLEEDHLNYEITSTKEEPVRSSGGNEGVSEIESREVFQVMRARLKR